MPTNLKHVLLDRDGVINFDSPDFIKSPAEWHPIDGAIDAIAALQSRFEVAVCTNQSGVGRGLLTEPVLGEIHDKLNKLLVAAGGQPVDVYYCPHLPDQGCPCRKPRPELLRVAMHAHDAEPSTTLYAGDSEKDLVAAENAGCTGALILTGNGTNTAKSQAGQRAGLTCPDLSALAARLLRERAAPAE